MLDQLKNEAGELQLEVKLKLVNEVLSCFMNCEYPPSSKWPFYLSSARNCIICLIYYTFQVVLVNINSVNHGVLDIECW